MSYIQEIRQAVGHRPLILVGALVLIFDENNQILLQHRTDDHTWDFPGGYMELGESTEETARREVLEETGLVVGDLTLDNIFSGKEFFFSYPNGDQVYSVCLVYITHDFHGILHADGDEGSEVRFFPITSLPSEMIPQAGLILEGFLKTHHP